MASPQKENGYTAIANELLERIIATGLNGTELACILFILRKIYGYNKKEDEISLSQFLTAIPVSKETICTALHNLQLVKIIRLVKKGNSKICSNLWAFNKDYDTWQLVKKTKLVKVSRPTSQDLPFSTSQENLTHKRQYTKDNTKERSFKMTNEDFSTFWTAYPRKVNKAKAKQRFLKLDKEKLSQIIKALELAKQTDQWKKDKGQFIPHPTSWLNGERWNDEIPEKSLEDTAKDMVAEYKARYGEDRGANIAMFEFEKIYFPGGKDQRMIKFFPIFEF